MNILNTNLPITVSKRIFDPRTWWLGRGKSRRRAHTNARNGSATISTAELMTLNLGYKFTRQQARREAAREQFTRLDPYSMPRKVRRQIARDVTKRAWKDHR
jgi:hypothetical protein